MIDQWLFYPLAVVAVMIAGISKGGFGGGLGVLAVPLMALVIPPFQAAAIMLPILCVMDIAGLRAFWRNWHVPNLKIMLPGALAGVAIAALTYRWVSEDAVRALIGVIALGFAANFYLNRGAGSDQPNPVSRARSTFWSTVAGFTSFSAHAGGPPVNIYLLPQRLDKTLFVGTTVVFFAFVNYVKLIPYTMMGQFVPDNLVTSLGLAPVAVAGIYSGLWLHKRVTVRWFYHVCYALLVITGSRLLYQGVSSIL